MTTLEEIWPVFVLRVEAGPVELSAICDDDIPLLVDLASGGIHEPGAMPFAVPWSTATDLGHGMAAYYWRTRGEFSPKGVDPRSPRPPRGGRRRLSGIPYTRLPRDP